jgi:nanoRNase/pAp phosphatase (c-di-AMP/oligoRNAs hydrolase)
MTRDGIIGRAENSAMVELLGLDLVPVEDLEFRDGERIVMVDSQPKTGRHSIDLLHTKRRLYGVIDHHDTPGDLAGVEFVDVRNDIGATCSVIASYVQEQRLKLPTDVATGLFYGIETELNGYPREASALDDEVLQYLYPLADKDLVARIRNARLPQSYFGCLLQALQSSFIYDRLIVSWINELPQPELAAEVVDFLVRFEEIDWAFCAGVYEDRLILSLRAAAPDARAGEMLRKVVSDMGRAGDHDRRAAAAYPAEYHGKCDREHSGRLRRRLPGPCV